MQSLVSKLLLFHSQRVFSQQRQLVVFHWSVNYSKSPRVSRTLFNILESKQCCGLESLDFSSDFHFLQFLFQVFDGCSSK